ncbi:AzlC family ABC transporter permease [Solibacillus sp. FSL R7-0682]|uniref:AzlC family ABC transporter permease n=1 Tax=Solibacillus sp. FSL R7-0682 TaxID=2921690 RepID=UPI0030FA86B7
MQAQEKVITQNTFLQGVKDCIPTLLGYISIGVAFGVVGIASGISVFEVFLLSVLVYAGSAQFIFCGLYLAGAPVTAVIVTIFIVNLRHLLMSLTIAPYFTKYSTLRNIGFGTLLTDETFGVSVVTAAKEGRLGGKWMDGLNITAYTTWIAACTIGGIIGQWLPNPEQWGLDYALVAMFIALLVLTLESIPRQKLMHYLKLIVIMIISMYGMLYWMPGHLAVLLSTLVVATIGVAAEK